MLEEKDFNKVCEECEKIEDSVMENLVMHGYKICNSTNYLEKLYFLSKNKLKL